MRAQVGFGDPVGWFGHHYNRVIGTNVSLVEYEHLIFRGCSFVLGLLDEVGVDGLDFIDFLLHEGNTFSIKISFLVPFLLHFLVLGELFLHFFHILVHENISICNILFPKFRV